MVKLQFPDLFTAAFNRDPYPAFARMRKEAPVYHHRFADGDKACFLTRYDDIERIFRDDERFSKDLLKRMTPEQIRRQHPALRLVQPSLVNQDPPDQSRLRLLVAA